MRQPNAYIWSYDSIMASRELKIELLLKACCYEK